jgi:hypothetical protein
VFTKHDEKKEAEVPHIGRTEHLISCINTPYEEETGMAAPEKNERKKGKMFTFTFKKPEGKEWEGKTKESIMEELIDEAIERAIK